MMERIIWRIAVRKRIVIPISWQYFIIGVIFWVIVDWGTAGGYRLTYFEKFGPTLLLFYIGYPLLFTVLIFKLKWSDTLLFLATLGAIFLIEVLFTRNPILLNSPALFIGIPLAIMVYMPLTYFPLWLVRKEVVSHKVIMLVLLFFELIIILLTTFGSQNL
jgi:hypothetical protein